MKPENEMLLAVLEPRTLKNGNTIYTGFMGMNSIQASEYQGKLFVKLVKWPKKEQPTTLGEKLSTPSFSHSPQFADEDVPF